MIKPQYLKKGDKIGIVSTAGKIEKEYIDNAVNVLSQSGFEVVLGKNILASNNMFAGTDEKRAFDFQQMINDESVKAIICSRGGYGTVRIIDKIDFSGLIKSPKWICGYSDVTVLHSVINQKYGIETIHGTMPISFSKTKSLELFIETLTGKIPEYEIKSDALNITGTAEGILTGGNLSVLYSLRGTLYDIDTDGKILFIEDLGEYLYHIDRMMMNLKIGGKLKNLKALIVGGMTDMKEGNTPYGKSANEIILDSVKEYDYPVCFNFPAGHIEENFPLIMGRKMKIEVGKEKVEVGY
ncbi:MAG: LD-carboxypeptidase [Bacteroidetes bacterium GWA2_31_9]|nr:MAG: LD-carboxypeptidase [Bacteroidetes bacterium GWA2_31_9]